MSRAGSKTKLKGKAAAKESPSTDPEVSWVVSSHPISYRTWTSPSVAIETAC